LLFELLKKVVEMLVAGDYDTRVIYISEPTSITAKQLSEVGDYT